MGTRTKLVGIALALVFLFLAVWKVDLDKLRLALATANYWYVLPAALVTLLGYAFRSLRWGRLLRPGARLSFAPLFSVLMIGFMANNVLPARAGELVRAYVLHRRAGVGKVVGLSTIILERLFDGLILVLFVGLLSMRFPLPEWATGLARLASLVLLGAAVGLVVLLLRADDALRLASRVIAVLPERFRQRVRAMVESSLAGVQALRHRNILLGALALSLLVWLAEALSYALIVRGFGLPLAAPDAASAAVFLLVVVNLAIMLPSAPGYVGTFQAFAVLALSAFGIQREVALGIAIVSHAMQYVLVTGLGLIFFWRGQFSLRRVAGQEGAT